MAPSPDWYTTLLLKPYWGLQLARAFIPFGIATRRAATEPRLLGWFRDLRREQQLGKAGGGLKIAAAGYCWGGPYAFMLAQRRPETLIGLDEDDDDEREGQGKEQTTLIDTAFVAHPASLAVPGDIPKYPMVPVSVANGDEDAFMGREGMETLKNLLLESESKFEGGEGGDVVVGHEHEGHEVVVYKGAKHGFATRADPKDAEQQKMCEGAEDQAVRWFEQRFGGG